MTELRISVIVPVLNEGRNARASLESARNAQADEVIVVDGGSTDGTCEACREFCDQLLETEPGRAIQQNRGAEAASGDVLLFLHADCTLPLDGIQAIRDALAESESALGGCFQQRIDANAGIYRVLEKGNAARVRFLGWAYGDQGIFLRRDTFEALGGFPDLRLMEDLYLMKRVKRQGRFLLLPQRLTVSARRWEKHGVLRQTIRNWSLITAAHLGMSTSRLRRFYADAR